MFWPEFRTGSCTAQACDIALAHPLQLLSLLRLYPHWAQTWLKNLQRRLWLVCSVILVRPAFAAPCPWRRPRSWKWCSGWISWQNRWMENWLSLQLKNKSVRQFVQRIRCLLQIILRFNPKTQISFNSCREYEKRLRIWTFEVCARNSVISAWILVRSWWWVVETVSSAGNRKQANSN